MKLYIKQKVFSWGDKFTVKDETGRDRYYVEGEIFTFGRKLMLISYYFTIYFPIYQPFFSNSYYHYIFLTV